MTAETIAFSERLQAQVFAEVLRHCGATNFEKLG
jgi:hypothetical protein